FALSVRKSGKKDDKVCPSNRNISFIDWAAIKNTSSAGRETLALFQARHTCSALAPLHQDSVAAPICVHPAASHNRSQDGAAIDCNSLRIVISASPISSEMLALRCPCPPFT